MEKVQSATIEYNQDILKFEAEAIEILQHFRAILSIDSEEEALELQKHAMATLTLYKDLFRIQLYELFSSLLSQEILNLPDGEVKEMLQFTTPESLASVIERLIENDFFLDGTEISLELKKIIINTIKKVSVIVDNWEFLSQETGMNLAYGDAIQRTKSSVKEMLSDDVNTFLGENLILRNNFISEVKKRRNLSQEEEERLQSLVKENGFRKVNFEYTLHFDKLRYLINSAIRYKKQLKNIREDVELFNLIVVLLAGFRTNPEVSKIINEIKNLYVDKPKILKHIDDLMAQDLSKARFIIENSPPIYKKFQKNSMHRIYEISDGGVIVHINSIPYLVDEVQKSFTNYRGSGLVQLDSLPGSVNFEEEDRTLTALFLAEQGTVNDLSLLNTTISRIGLDTIEINDGFINPIIDSLMSLMKNYIEELSANLPAVVHDPALREEYIKKYEDRIRAAIFHFQELDKVKASNLDSNEIEKIQDEVLDRVMGGQSFESAVKDIVGDKDFAFETESSGDCVTFETKVENKSSEVGPKTDYSSFKDGTILSSKSVEGNGFTSTIEEKVVDGKKVNIVTCLVCKQKFDTCNEACSNEACGTPRAIQYAAIYGDKRDADIRAAIKEIQERIEGYSAKVDESVENPEINIRNRHGNQSSWLGDTFGGMVKGFISALSFWAPEEPEYQFEG